MGGRRLIALALLAACATGKLHDAVDFEGRRLHTGMSSDEAIGAAGPPDFVAPSGHRFAWRFGKEAAAIDPAWEEWVWYPRDDWYIVAYLSSGTVMKVGIAWDSPVPKDDPLLAIR